MILAKPIVLWITGLSGSGKTTLAETLANMCQEDKYILSCVLLDGDRLRQGVCSDLGFDAHSRHEQIRRTAHFAKLLLDQGFIPIVSLISPFRQDRHMAKKIIGDNHAFKEIYLNTPLRICEERDSKGLYKKARCGLIDNFTGISSAYEAPESPEATIDTSAHNTHSNIKKLWRQVKTWCTNQNYEHEYMDIKL